MRRFPYLTLAVVLGAASPLVGSAFVVPTSQGAKAPLATRCRRQLSLASTTTTTTTPSFALELEQRYQICQWEDSVLDEKIQAITTIASDIDGTILGTDHVLSPYTKEAIQRAVDETRNTNGKLGHFFPATGKSRRGALDSLA